MSKHKSFYQSEFLPAERKDLAQAGPSSPGLPGLDAASGNIPRLPASTCLPIQVSSDLSPMVEAPSLPLTDEIGVLKVAIRRMFALSKEQPAEEAVRTLAQLATVTSRLAGLIRTQQLILYDLLKSTGRSSGDSDLRLMLENVLAEVQQEWPKL